MFPGREDNLKVRPQSVNRCLLVFIVNVDTPECEYCVKFSKSY